jgi:hypothetical protein
MAVSDLKIHDPSRSPTRQQVQSQGTKQMQFQGTNEIS